MKRYRRPRRPPWFPLFFLEDDRHPFVASAEGNGVGAVVDDPGSPYFDAPSRAAFREAYRRGLRASGVVGYPLLTARAGSV